jgi:predicted RNA-binding protein with RPS1 domain/O-acetyl-ADP-ribose deacetylase (regulator of RNase III)
MPIIYVKGAAASFSATESQPGKYDSHILGMLCNNADAWGKGFSRAVTQEFGEIPEKRFHEIAEAGNDQLGRVYITGLGIPDRYLAFLYAQDGMKSEQNRIPLSYYYLEDCFYILFSYAEVNNAAIHLPYIGTGLAGGDWPTILAIIKNALEDHNVDVFIYNDVQHQRWRRSQIAAQVPFPGSLEFGHIYTGPIRAITEHGAFVEVGGARGLVHNSELGVDKEEIEVGQSVTVKVMGINRERERISLSMEAAQNDPFEIFARNHAAGQVVQGWVTNVVPYGAFVEVEGVEGLIHKTQFANGGKSQPRQSLQVGADVKVRVIKIDRKRRRIALSLRHIDEVVPIKAFGTNLLILP